MRKAMRTLEVKLGGLEADGHTFEGYGAIFGLADKGGDVIVPGAFAASLARHEVAGTLPAMLWQHDAARPVGVWTEIAEDDRGLRVKGELITEAPDGAMAAALIGKGAITGLSIGYRTIRSEAIAGGGRRLLELDVWEISPVTFPMQGSATIDKKAVEACPDLKTCEQLMRDAGFSHTAAAAMVSRIKAIEDRARDGRDALDRFEAAARRFNI